MRFRNALWYGTAVLIVGLALSFTAVRLALSHVPDYRRQVEAWIGAYAGQPVRIERLDARLFGLSPTLVMDGVHLLDTAGDRSIARFKKIRVGIDPIASLFAGTPIMSELTVVGADLVVVRLADGSLQVEGLVAPDDAGDPKAIGRWLLAQDRLALRDSTLRWRDRRQDGSGELAFEDVSLELRKNGNRHRLDASLRMPADLGRTLRLAADLRGDLLQPASVAGEIYADVEQARPAGLLGQLPVPGEFKAEGEMNFKAWARWAGQLQSVQGTAEVQRLAIRNGGSSAAVTWAETRFRWERHANGNAFALDDLKVVRNGRTWEPTQVRLDYARAPAGGLGPWRLQASYARVEDVTALAQVLPLAPGLRAQLAELAPRGELRGFTAQARADGTLAAGTHFHDLFIMATPSRPGASGLDGYVWYDADRAGARLDTRDAQVFIPSLFREPLALSKLQGDLRLRRDGPVWRLEGRGLELANPDINARVRLALTLPKQGSPFLDLAGDYHGGRATSVYRYLPAHIMPADSVSWLDRAFKAGEVTSGAVLFHGALADFPFDRGEGRFEVRFQARDVVLDYLPKWPQLTGVNGEVVFDGRRMTITADSARLLRSAVGSTTVTIPDLSHARLQVQGQVEGPFADVLDYLRVTGLAGHFGDTLARFTPDGPSALNLNFEQPLDGNGTGRAGGSLTFLDSRLKVTEGVELTGIRGKLDFEEERYSARGIAAYLFEQPVAITVASRAQNTEVTFAGVMPGEALAQRFPSLLTARLGGRTPWQGQLTLGHGPEDGTALTVRTKLGGLAVELPEPLGKTQETEHALEVNHWFSGPRADQTSFSLDDRASMIWDTGPTGKWMRAAIHFGPGAAALPERPEIRITGRLDRFSPGPWVQLLHQSVPQDRSGTGTNARLPVVVAMKALNVIGGGNASASTRDAPVATSALPPFSVLVDEFAYEGAMLGQLAFTVAPEPGQIALKDFSLRGTHLDIGGAGRWQQAESSRTQLELQIKSPNLGALSKRLGLASVVAKGRLDATAKLSWPGAPGDFAAAHLNGDLHIGIKDGVLEEVRPGAGRLLGLLSLEALPRRLTLDFRDLFEKGVSFRRIRGNLRVENGDAYTDDLHMDTLPASVFVKGRTGLARRDYDHTVTVVPEVAGTLPVAGGIALGPQVGAALLLVQSVFKDKIDHAARIRYTVTGPWEKPVITRAQ